MRRQSNKKRIFALSKKGGVEMHLHFWCKTTDNTLCENNLKT